MDNITLIKVLVSDLLNAQEEFLEHLDQFSIFEKTVNELTDQIAADFIGLTLTAADTLIRESGKRKSNYTVQRSRSRIVFLEWAILHLRIPCIKIRRRRHNVCWMNCFVFRAGTVYSYGRSKSTE